MQGSRVVLSAAAVAVVSLTWWSNSKAVEDGNAGSDNSAALTEIIVTAQRREESIEKVPISITAFTQRTMDDLHIESLADLGTLVPGLSIQPTNSFQDNDEVIIRGIIGSVGTAPTTQLYIDETPIAIRELGAAYSKSPWPNIFDLDHVEVLRGPQGVLFGASAMGGAVRFITPQPSLTETGGFTKADIGYTQGGDPDYEVGAAYGSPISTGVAGFRVSAWYQSLGGFIDREDPYTGQILTKNANTSNAYVVRPALTVAPTDALSITASFYFQRNHDQNPNAYWIDNLPNREGGHDVWGGLNEPMTDDLRVSSISLKYNFEKFSFVSDTSYLDRTTSTLEDTKTLIDLAFTGEAVVPGLENWQEYNLNISYTHAWQQEFRFTSSDSNSPFTWTAGLYYRTASQGLQQIEAQDLTPITEAAFGLTSQQVFGQPDFQYNGQALSGYAFFRAKDISEAAFADAAWAISSKLKLDVGVRYEHVIVEDQNQLAGGPLNGGTSQVTLPDAIANPVTPRVSSTYQLTDAAMVYASAAKGFRPGGGNSVAAIDNNPACIQDLHNLGLSQVPPTFGPDNVWSYEVGTKDRFFNGRLSVDASAYYINWRDIQSPVSLPGNCNNQYIGNSGHAVSQGFDLQMTAQIVDGLTASTLVGYTDAYYPDATYSLPPSAGAAAPLIRGAGDKIQLVLPWTAAANMQYSIDISSLWASAKSYVRVDYRWLDAEPRQDPRVANADPQTIPYPGPSYGVLNLRLGVTHGGLDLSAYVNNATHANPALAYNNLIAGTSTFFSASAIRPMTTGITAWYRF